MADSQLEKIKRLTIIALVSDDTLMEQIVLKGGNALRLIHGIPVRQSLDLDFSIEGDFGPLDKLREKIGHLLASTFQNEDLSVFDIELEPAPLILGEDFVGAFWGGYTLEFKVMPTISFTRLAGKPDKQSRQAMELGTGGRRAFTVDFSKHEYCAGKEIRAIDGYRVFVYSPLMIACEKIRAICQQMPDYRRIVGSRSSRPRARDFFDIHYLVTESGVDLRTPQAWAVLESVFAAKHVPLHLIGAISEQREFHRDDFSAVRDTVQSMVLLEFDDYVDFLIEQLRPLQSRWEVQPPTL
jgi:predicted nucleotidyltransferase component of viral defense system